MLSSILLQQAGSNQVVAQILMLVAIVGVFYFFMIRPQVKKQKEAKNFRESLSVGDKVITMGGIYGKIAEMSDQTVILEVEGKMRLKIDKSALVKDSSELMQQK